MGSNHLSVNLKNASLHFGMCLKRHFRPEERELAEGKKEEDCFLHSSAVGLKRCLLLRSLLFLPLLAPDSKPPPCWPRARRDGRLHRIENSSRDFPLSDKGSVFLLERERQIEWKEGRFRVSEIRKTLANKSTSPACITIHYHRWLIDVCVRPHTLRLKGSTAILIVSVRLNASR